MTRKELLDKFDPIYNKYVKFCRSSKLKSKYSPIIYELMEKWFNTWFANREDFNLEIPSKIKFFGNYRRKEVVRIFIKLGLKVTRYTREYGRTIVHFEPASDS